MPTLKTRQITRPPLPVTNLQHWAENVGIAPALISNGWTVANLIVYVPVELDTPCQPFNVSVLLGAVVSGFCLAGVYLPDSEGKPGARLWGSQVAVPSTISSWLAMAPSFAAIPPVHPSGLVYLAFTANNSTLQLFILAVLSADGRGTEGQIYTEQAASFALPAVATPSATPVVTIVPVLVLR